MQVQCYAGRKADERPVRFRIGGRDRMVEDILEQWYGPDGSFFKVRAEDGKVYLLRYGTAAGLWTMESAGNDRADRVRPARVKRQVRNGFD